jgi:hypothetical protein
MPVYNVSDYSSVLYEMLDINNNLTGLQLRTDLYQKNIWNRFIHLLSIWNEVYREDV